MNKQILDISQMQHLKELGVDTSSGSAYWHRVVRMDTNEVVTNWFVSFSEPSQCLATMKVETVQTFTLQDIIDLLPKEIEVEKSFFFDTFYLYIDFGCDQIKYAYDDSCEGLCEYKCSDFSEDNSLIDAAYYMLCWCIVNGFVKTNKEDKACQ